MFRLILFSLSFAVAAAIGHQQTTLPAVKLLASRDSFFIMVNARAVGTSTYAVTPTPTGFSIKETISIPNSGAQATEVIVDSAGHPKSVIQTGRMGTEQVGVNLNYADGRVRGMSKLPGGRTLTIDKPVPAAVLDDNTLQAILPLLPWTAESSWKMSVYSAASDAVASQALQMTDEIPVSIPAGKFDAYRVELRTDAAVVAFYISKTTPHKILKIVPGGSPFEYVRAN